MSSQKRKNNAIVVRDIERNDITQLGLGEEGDRKNSRDRKAERKRSESIER